MDIKGTHNNFGIYSLHPIVLESSSQYIIREIFAAVRDCCAGGFFDFRVWESTETSAVEISIGLYKKQKTLYT